MIVGFAAIFLGRLQGLIMIVLDALAVIALIIGGVVRPSSYISQMLASTLTLPTGKIYAVKLGVHSCSSSRYQINPITDGGSHLSSTNTYTYYGNPVKMCHMAQADTAFLFFALAAFIASLVMDVLDLLHIGKSGGGKRGGRRRRRRQESVEEEEYE